MKTKLTIIIGMFFVGYAMGIDWDQYDAQQAQKQIPFMMIMQIDQQQRAEQQRYQQQQQALRLQEQELELREREMQLQRQIEYQRAKDNEGFFEKLKNAWK